MRHLRRSAVLLAVAALVGCGNDRFEPRSLEVNPGQGTRTLRYPSVGLTVALPRGFGIRGTARPGVFRANLGEAFISAYAYRRAEQLPRNDEELKTARERLERTIKGRSKAWKLRSARTTRVGGARTIEVVGDQTLSKRRLRTRSLHLFQGSAEYVIEVAVPVENFKRFDRAVTPTMKRTLKVSGKFRKAPSRPARRARR